MRRGSKLFIVGLSVITIALISWRLTHEEAIAVEVYTVSLGEVLSTIANTRAGTVKACQRARLSPNASGQVTALNVTEGSMVQPGDVLMELWHRDLDAQLSLAQQQALSTEQRAAATCVRADTASRDAQRGQDLKKKGFISDEQLDQRVSGADASAIACRADNLSATAANAQIEVISAALDRTRLRAPFAGVVAEVNAEIGEFMTPSPTGIATLPAIDLIDTSCLYVSAPIDEVDAPRVSVDQEVIISLDAFQGQRISGRVRRVAPYVLDLEKQARTVEVEANFTEPEQARNMLVGYSADIEVVLTRKNSVLRLPTSAIFDDDRVYRINADQTLEKVTVTTGLSSWSFIEITGGLKAGDLIVNNPARKTLATGLLVSDKALVGDTDDD
ncbi:MAG: efflux RND transporter periplasmic adaptor subunit [Immundisolibacteraceae bacterium]|nr:efflux RND transporter periplasmic adaptor subunit [Immundisolibacteraceae bacterium]